jgi:hypothetical protein
MEIEIRTAHNSFLWERQSRGLLPILKRHARKDLIPRAALPARRLLASYNEG